MSSVAFQSAGDREASGAIDGMREVYGRPLPSVGQWVTGVVHGNRFSGEVLSAEPGRVAVELDGAWIVVRPSDIDD